MQQFCKFYPPKQIFLERECLEKQEFRLTWTSKNYSNQAPLLAPNFMDAV